jgi:hypothetical protein
VPGSLRLQRGVVIDDTFHFSERPKPISPSPSEIDTGTSRFYAQMFGHNPANVTSILIRTPQQLNEQQVAQFRQAGAISRMLQGTGESGVQMTKWEHSITSHQMSSCPRPIPSGKARCSPSKSQWPIRLETPSGLALDGRVLNGLWYSIRGTTWQAKDLSCLEG